MGSTCSLYNTLTVFFFNIFYNILCINHTILLHTQVSTETPQEHEDAWLQGSANHCIQKGQF